MNNKREGWRLIKDVFYDGYMNMAIDEAIFIACEKGFSPKTIRFYGWNPPAISIGYFQKTSYLFESKRMNELSLDMVRRPTGGRAVFHEEEVTYSIISSLDAFSRNGVLEPYRMISHALVSGLKSIGVPAELLSKRKRGQTKGTDSPSCFSSSSLYEIVTQGKKIIGSAQKRSRNFLLQQGSILLDLNREKWTSIFKTEDDNRMISLQEVLNRKISFREVSKALIEALNKSFGPLFQDKLTLYEKRLSERLRKQKYTTQEWNFQR